MGNIIKNLNHTAEEINDILASVSTKAGESELVNVKNDLNNLSTYVHEQFKKKTTLAEYGIEDANISETTITLGENSIDVATATALNTTVNDLTSLIETNEQNISNLQVELGNLESRVVTIEGKTTISDYGITDAKIDENVVTLGEVTIKPLIKDSWKVGNKNYYNKQKKFKNRLVESTLGQESRY